MKILQIPPIPHGWRLLKEGAQIVEGDKYHSMESESPKWYKTNVRDDRQVGWHPCLIYIRRIKPRKKH